MDKFQRDEFEREMRLLTIAKRCEFCFGEYNIYLNRHNDKFEKTKRVKEIIKKWEKM